MLIHTRVANQVYVWIINVYSAYVLYISCILLASLFMKHLWQAKLVRTVEEYSLPLLMTVLIGSTPPKFINSSLVLLSFMETSHIHLMICISALSKFNPTSASKGLVSP